jgi:hypothetical protein
LESIRQQAAPPLPLAIASAVNGTNLSLTINTYNGPQYILEASPSLTSPVWTPICTNLGLGVPLTNNVPLDSPSQFFRYVAH